MAPAHGVQQVRRNECRAIGRRSRGATHGLAIPLEDSLSGPGRAQYNSNTGGSWQLMSGCLSEVLGNALTMTGKMLQSRVVRHRKSALPSFIDVVADCDRFATQRFLSSSSRILIHAGNSTPGSYRPRALNRWIREDSAWR